MYHNLITEMERNDISRRKLSELSGIKYSTISDKLNGRTKFDFDEAMEIKRTAFPTLSVEYLFHKDEKEMTDVGDSL